MDMEHEPSRDYEKDGQPTAGTSFDEVHEHPEEAPTSGRIRTQRAIINSELFWHGKIMDQRDREEQMRSQSEFDDL